MYKSREKSKAGLFLLFILALVMVLALSTNVSAAAKKKGRLNYAKKSIYVEKIFKLKASRSKAKSWSSSNPSVAKVSKYGNVKGRSAGTAKIYARLENGKRVYCIVTVKENPASNSSSQYLTSAQTQVMLNVLGAVETGGQVYGNRDYKSFENPYAASPGEHSSTAGAYQEFGENLRQLLLSIQKDYPSVFKTYDKANIASDIKRPWTSSNPYSVRNGSAKAKSIINIISTPQGKLVQDQRAIKLMDEYLKHIRSLGVTNVQAALFMAECEHLGGASSVERVVKRATNKNNINSLWKSLMKDQQDTSNSYQIGDKIYQSRHKKCYSWLKNKISASAKLL